MSIVVNKTTLEVFQNANTPDFSPENWLINPDFSEVQGWPQKYWKVENNSLLLMSEAERKVIDDREAALFALETEKQKITTGIDLIAKFRVVISSFPAEESAGLMVLLRECIFALQIGAIETAAYFLGQVEQNAILDAQYTAQVWDLGEVENKTIRQRFVEMAIEAASAL